MIKHIYILQSPRSVGGAGSSSIHLADLLLQNNIAVTMFTQGIGDEKSIEYCKSKGVEIQPWPTDWSFLKDQVCINWGQAKFLMELQKIKEAKPHKIIYITAMWEPSNIEVMTYQANLIDDIIPVSKAQASYHQQFLQNKSLKINYRQPLINYFNLNGYHNITYNYKIPETYFGIGRVQRPDPYKFNLDLWKQYDSIKTTLPKQYFINGWDMNVEKVLGKPLENATTYYPYAIQIKDFLNKIHMMVQTTNTFSGESWGLYQIEAMAAGVPLVLHDNGLNALNEIGEPSRHFLYGKNSQHIVEVASDLAEDQNRMQKMAMRSREHLTNTFGNVDYCWSYWRELLCNL